MTPTAWVESTRSPVAPAATAARVAAREPGLSPAQRPGVPGAARHAHSERTRPRVDRRRDRSRARRRAAAQLRPRTARLVLHWVGEQLREPFLPPPNMALHRI